MSFGADIRGLYQLRRTARLTNDSPNSLFVEHSHNGRYRRPRPPLILSDYHIYDGVVRLERYSLERTPLFLLPAPSSSLFWKRNQFILLRVRRQFILANYTMSFDF